MNRPTAVSALPGYKLHLSYPDGIEGVIDLSEFVQRGVFRPLADPKFFATVHIGKHGQISWSEDLEICPVAAYIEIAAHLEHA